MDPIRPLTFPHKFRYIVSFVDEFSGYAYTYCIKTRYEVPDCFEEFLTSARNKLGRDAKVCYLRCDDAKDYVHGKMSKICKKEKIEIDYHHLILNS